MRVLINCLLSLFLLALLLAVSPPAEAKRGLGRILLAPFGNALSRAKLKGGSSQYAPRHTGTILTKAQLRKCVVWNNRIDAESGQLDSESAALDSAGEREIQTLTNDIRKLGNRIDAEEPFVNVYSQKSVDDFNRLITRHKTMAARQRVLVDKHNAKISEFRQKQESHNSQVDGFNQQCAHSYYEEDMDEILAESSEGDSSE